MTWLYHRVPEKVEGTILYPLNRLKKHLPKLYKKELEKYNGREKILDYDVPPLQCKWNDVLHLTAVNPENLAREMIKAGFSKKKTWRFFKIDSSQLDPQHLCVYKFNFRGSPIGRHDLKGFEPFTSAHLKFYSTIRNKTIRYWKESMKAGKVPLQFVFVPHILYKGTIDISKAEVIEV